MHVLIENRVHDAIYGSTMTGFCFSDAISALGSTIVTIWSNYF